ncbi:MAG: hypothetical protein J7M25_05470 [Deltaproteobacteria bacterium]|nr:hypothetical protein [Deltaproteobacteria bacterium]
MVLRNAPTIGSFVMSWLFTLLVSIAPSACSGSSHGSEAVDAGLDAQPTLISRQEVVEGCLRSDVCGVMPYGYLSHCVTSHYDQAFDASQGALWSQIYRCVNQAEGNCKAVRQCYGGGSDLLPCKELDDGFCDRDVRVYCDVMDRKLYRFDCRSTGQVCALGTLPGGQTTPFCGYGACDSTDYEANCAGNLLLTCDQGYVNIRDCATDGVICGKTNNGNLGCVGQGDPCPRNMTATCQGPVLNTCVGGRQAIIHCENLPGEKNCDPKSLSCVGAGTECIDGQDQERCDGNKVVVCLDGYWYEVDCVELGFTRCEIVGGAGAHCR